MRLYDRYYRAIVVHSSAHDKRRHKRIDRLSAKKRKDLDTLCKKIRSAIYFCRAGAEAAADKLHAAAIGSYHKLECNIEKVAKFGRGRPVKDKPRIPAGYEYQLHLIIVNSIFLKKNHRIEVLGLILLISLLIWRLMERSMRQYVETNDCTLPGWVRRKTKKPTAFMMTTKFASVMVITVDRKRQLTKPLKPFQQEYLQALGVPIDAFTVPYW